jgi:hypothetical protein
MRKIKLSQNPHPWDKACGQKYQNFPPGANVTSVTTHNMSKMPNTGVGKQCQNTQLWDSQERQLPTPCLGPPPSGLTLIGAQI